MESPRRLTWLITGCSSGFGYDLSSEALARGDRVIATARNGPARLADLEAKGASVLDLDVTWSQEQINAVVQVALGLPSGGIDVLVNNAGYVGLGTAEELPLTKIQDGLETMTFGPLKILRAILPHWRAKKAGTHVVISSIYGFTGGAATSVYSAAKFCLEGIIECAAQELASFNIENIIFEPGWYRTEMANPKNIQLASGHIEDYDSLRKGINDYAKQIHGKQIGDPRKAVKHIVDVVRREGVAQGKTTIPLRLPLGQDGYDTVRKKCTETVKDLDDWESLLADTNIES